MDKIFDAIKCANCRSILESPIVLPCSHSICKKHVSDKLINCGECGAEHRTGETTTFPINQALARIIEAEIGALEFGNVHREARKSCETLSHALKQIRGLQNDPNHFTHEKISGLRDEVQIKGEELKLKIDQDVNRLIEKLDKFEFDCQQHLVTNEYAIEYQRIDGLVKTCLNELETWIGILNKIKFDESKWSSIKKESDEKTRRIQDEIRGFQKELLLNRFERMGKEIELFKNINIDQKFEYSLIKIDTHIVDWNLRMSLTNLLDFPVDSKWSCVYRASQAGFKSGAFLRHCDGENNVLVVIKSANGDVFGGYSSVGWDSGTGDYKKDDEAFIFSLVNGENKPVKMKINNGEDRAIHCGENQGPVFGAGHDIFIADCPNDGTPNCSKLGVSYSHPYYSGGSDEANCFLAGSEYFQVIDIEVFRRYND